MKISLFIKIIDKLIKINNYFLKDNVNNPNPIIIEITIY